MHTLISGGATMLNKRREGFTLIELLIVVVIIGILAAIAIPKFGATREKAYVSAMKSDLRNLQSAQEMYYAGPGDYTYLGEGSASSTGDTPSMIDFGGDEFTASQGVTITLVSGDAQGWSATASHVAFGEDPVCSVYVGEAEPPSGNDAGPGVVFCDIP